MICSIECVSLCYGLRLRLSKEDRVFERRSGGGESRLFRDAAGGVDRCRLRSLSNESHRMCRGLIICARRRGLLERR